MPEPETAAPSSRPTLTTDERCSGPVYGVFYVPTGECNLTDTDPSRAWHHASRANTDCPCGTEPLRHIVRRIPDANNGGSDG